MHQKTTQSIGLGKPSRLDAYVASLLRDPLARSWSQFETHSKILGPRILEHDDDLSPRHNRRRGSGNHYDQLDHEEEVLSDDKTVAPCAPSIGEIFRTYGSAYLKKFADKMHSDQIKAMVSIMRCRTPDSGSVVYRCEQCQKFHHVLKSCGNRHCPVCQGGKAKAWLQKQLGQLLPCAYFMLTFTVPAEFRLFMRSHPRECYKALFEAAKETLFALAADPKYIGSANIGATGVLHTWGRDLNYHPHLHFIVPGGAIGLDGISWLSSRVDFLIPVLAASVIFQAKYKAIMQRLGYLVEIPTEVWDKAWNVNCKAVGDGRLALRYLAPYIFRVAIRNSRIVKVEPGPDGTGAVTFTYRPSGTSSYKPMRVSAEEFIRRFLQHVLPSGFQKIRHFGFAHPRANTNWEWLSMLVTVTLNMVYVLTVAAKPLPEKRTLKCPECGGELTCLGFVASAPRRLTEFDTS